jgi:hypothetical protein
MQRIEPVVTGLVQSIHILHDSQNIFVIVGHSGSACEDYKVSF